MKIKILLLLLIVGFSNAGYQINDCKVHNIIIESPYHDCWTPVDWQLVDEYPDGCMSIYGLKNDDSELSLTCCSNDDCTGNCTVIDETLKFTNYCLPRQSNSTEISWLLVDSEYYSAFDTVRWLGVSYGHPCNTDCYCNSSTYCVGCYGDLWGESCNTTCECTDLDNGYCDRYTGTCECYLGHELSENGTCEYSRCNHRCACDENDDCQLCYPGWWGPKCEFDCSLDCDGGTCDFENGDCDEGDDATYATCSVSDWGDWSECSNQCNGGVRYRTRSVDYVYPVNTTCPDTAEYETCNAQLCPVLKFEMTGDSSDDVETNIITALSEYVSSSIRYTLLTSQTTGSTFTCQIIFYYDIDSTEINYSKVVEYVESGLMTSIETDTGYEIVEDSIFINGVNIFQGGEDIYLTAIIFLEETMCNESLSTTEAALALAKKNYEQFNSASITVEVKNCTDLTNGNVEIIIEMIINPDVDSMSTETAENELEGNEEAALSFLDYFSTNSVGLQLLEESVDTDITVGGKIEVLYTDYTGSDSNSSDSSGAVIGLSVAVVILAIAAIAFFIMWKRDQPTPSSVAMQGDYSYSRM